MTDTNLFNPHARHLFNRYPEEMRRARALRGLTQEQVAEGVGISKTMVQRYEMDREKQYAATPSPATAMRIEAFFDSTPVKSSKSNDGATKSGETLQDVSLDDLLNEVKRRGYQITLQSQE